MIIFRLFWGTSGLRWRNISTDSVTGRNHVRRSQILRLHKGLLHWLAFQMLPLRLPWLLEDASLHLGSRWALASGKLSPKAHTGYELRGAGCEIISQSQSERKGKQSEQSGASWWPSGLGHHQPFLLPQIPALISFSSSPHSCKEEQVAFCSFKTKGWLWTGQCFCWELSWDTWGPSLISSQFPFLLRRRGEIKSISK